MSRYINYDAIDYRNDKMHDKSSDFLDGVAYMAQRIEEAPSIEPNLILPERMERGDIYEVGETIVVMNHDDYYDLLCKSWEPKRGEWITCWDAMGENEDGYKCTKCSGIAEEKFAYCPNCGARM